MPKSDWTEEGGWIDWEDLATEAGWVSPEQLREQIRAFESEMREDIKGEEIGAVTREFERLVALDDLPRALGDKILRVIQNEVRYGRG